MRYSSRLDFLPFGQLPLEEHGLVNCDWQHHLTQLRNTAIYDWILLDVPAEDPLRAVQAISISDHTLMLLQADPQSHVRLHQQPLPANSHYLVNQFAPGSQLQQDILLLWQQGLPRLLPFILHRDEAMAESLAGKQPVGELHPQSKISQDVTTLANWCLINLRSTQK